MFALGLAVIPSAVIPSAVSASDSVRLNLPFGIFFIGCSTSRGRSTLRVSASSNQNSTVNFFRVTGDFIPVTPSQPIISRTVDAINRNPRPGQTLSASPERINTAARSVTVSGSVNANVSGVGDSVFPIRRPNGQGRVVVLC